MRNFNQKDLQWIANATVELTKTLKYEGDESDLGNEIGFIIGNRWSQLTEDEINSICAGIRHGISLTNGTHG